MKKSKLYVVGIATVLVVAACVSRPGVVREDGSVSHNVPVMAQDTPEMAECGTPIGNQICFSSSTDGSYLSDATLIDLMRQMNHWQNENPTIRVVETEFFYFFAAGYSSGAAHLAGVWVRFD